MEYELTNDPILNQDLLIITNKLSNKKIKMMHLYIKKLADKLDLTLHIHFINKEIAVKFSQKINLSCSNNVVVFNLKHFDPIPYINDIEKLPKEIEEKLYFYIKKK